MSYGLGSFGGLGVEFLDNSIYTPAQVAVMKGITRVMSGGMESPWWPASWGDAALLRDGSVVSAKGVVPDVVRGTYPGNDYREKAWVQLSQGWSGFATDIYGANHATTQVWYGQGPAGFAVPVATPPQATGGVVAPPAPAPAPSMPTSTLTPIPAASLTRAPSAPSGVATTMPVGPGFPLDTGAGGGGGGAIPVDPGTIDTTGAVAAPASVQDIPWWWWLVGAASVYALVRRRPRGQ